MGARKRLMAQKQKEAKKTTYFATLRDIPSFTSKDEIRR